MFSSKALTKSQPVFISPYNHNSIAPYGNSPPVGDGNVYPEGDGATFEGNYFISEYLPTAREAYETVKRMGPIQEWSFFAEIEDAHLETREGRDVLVWDKVKMVEVSPVFIGAQIDTKTLAIKSDDKSDGTAEPTPDEAQTFGLDGAEQDVLHSDKAKAIFARYEYDKAITPVGE